MENRVNQRAGFYMSNPNGYRSFMPKPLPPEPPIIIDDEMQRLLSDADRKIGRLDGITRILPNPELFVAMYVKKEALLSSQIEGTQASLIDVLNPDEPENQSEHSIEVVDYVDAMNYGLKRLKELPLSLRLIREIHGVLLKHGRGSNRNPGEFRTSQNWIGPASCTLATASFVPPAVPDMQQALNDLELFFHEESNIPVLIKIALIHAQFETIHPFLDGNGRIGRLLITFWLCQQGILEQPLLYLSYYFKQNRMEYYDRLMDVRLKGAWEEWIKFFLKGVSIVADESTRSSVEILELREEYQKQFLGQKNGGSIALLQELFYYPIVSKKLMAKVLQVADPTASKLVDDFVRLGILFDLDSDRQRGKRYIFKKYVDILSRGTEL